VSEETLIEPLGALRRRAQAPAAQTAAAPAASERELTELVHRARAGSADAFEQLVVEVGPRLHRFLALRLRDDHQARDALQETLLAAWQGLPRLAKPERFWSWIAGIAAHKAADAARRRRRAEAGIAPEPFGEDDAPRIVELREALDTLPAHLRDVLLLRHVLELSEHEVAAALGVRVGTVKSRAARARRRLAELMA
jgi:RNA polymerase sigma-70 factor (ECF subfamily)